MTQNTALPLKWTKLSDEVWPVANAALIDACGKELDPARRYYIANLDEADAPLFTANKRVAEDFRAVYANTMPKEVLDHTADKLIEALGHAFNETVGSALNRQGIETATLKPGGLCAIVAEEQYRTLGFDFT